MSYEGYIKTEGSSQGVFKGESPIEGHKDQAPIINIATEISVPSDPQSGSVTGPYRIMPVTVIKELGASSPQYMNACTQTEMLKSVVIEFWTIVGSGDATDGGAGGKPQCYYRITLKDAFVIGIQVYRQYDTKNPGGGQSGETTVIGGRPMGKAVNDTRELQAVSFSCRTYEEEHLIGRTQAIAQTDAPGEGGGGGGGEGGGGEKE